MNDGSIGNSLAWGIWAAPEGIQLEIMATTDININVAMSTDNAIGVAVDVNPNVTIEISDE